MDSPVGGSSQPPGMQQGFPDMQQAQDAGAANKTQADPTLMAMLSDSVASSDQMQAATKTYTSDSSAPDIPDGDPNATAASEKDVKLLNQKVKQKAQGDTASLMKGYSPELQALLKQNSSDPSIQQLQGGVKTTANMSALASIGLQAVPPMQAPDYSSVTSVPPPGPITGTDPAQKAVQQLSNTIDSTGKAAQIAGAQAAATPGPDGESLSAFMSSISAAISKLQEFMGSLASQGPSKSAQAIMSGAQDQAQLQNSAIASQSQSSDSGGGGMLGGLTNMIPGMGGGSGGSPLSGITSMIPGGDMLSSITKMIPGMDLITNLFSSLTHMIPGMGSGEDPLSGLTGMIPGMSAGNPMASLTGMIPGASTITNMIPGVNTAGSNPLSGLTGMIPGMGGSGGNPLSGITDMVPGMSSITGMLSGAMKMDVPPLGDLIKGVTGPLEGLPIVGGFAKMLGDNPMFAVVLGATALAGVAVSVALFPEGILLGATMVGGVAAGGMLANGGTGGGGGSGDILGGLSGMFSGLTNMIPGMGGGGNPLSGLTNMIPGMGGGDPLSGLTNMIPGMGGGGGDDGIAGKLGLGGLTSMEIPLVGPMIKSLAAPFESLPIVGPMIGWAANNQLGALVGGAILGGGGIMGIPLAAGVMGAQGMPIPIVSDLMNGLGGMIPGMGGSSSSSSPAHTAGSSVPTGQAMGEVAKNTAKNNFDQSDDTADMIANIQQLISILQKLQAAAASGGGQIDPSAVPTGAIMDICNKLQSEGFGKGQAAGDSLAAAMQKGQAGDTEGMLSSLTEALSSMNVDPSRYATADSTASAGLSLTSTPSSDDMGGMLQGMMAA